MNLSVLSGIFPDVRINTIQFFMTFSIFFRVLHDIFRDSMQGKSHVCISFPSYFYCWFNPPFYNRIHYSSVRVCQARCAVSLIAAIKTLDFCTILFFGNCQSLKPAINIFFCVIEHIKFIIITHNKPLFRIHYCITTLSCTNGFCLHLSVIIIIHSAVYV